MDPQPSLSHPVRLDQWLELLQHQHSKAIDLSLDRVREVAQRLQLKKPAPLVITVGGTNGKGSTVALLRAMLVEMGLSVGSYTSPHLLHFRERIQLPDRYASDDELLAAFNAIEQARGAITLTFFETTTLAAFEIFQRSALDVAILEVGLGGRLDAVNIIDADAAILTTVDLDHQDYLGPTRELIGMEKAGIFRWDQIAVYADDAPVDAVVKMAEKLGTKLLRPKRDYRVLEHTETEVRGFELRLPDGTSHILPYPRLLAPVQVKNAAAAIVLLHALQPKLGFDIEAIKRGLLHARIAGRLQRVGMNPDIFLDVAHNPQAANSLVNFLHRAPIYGKTYAIYGGMADKDVLSVVSELKNHVHFWFLTALDQETSRGLDAMALVARVRGATLGNYESFAAVTDALDAAIKKAKANDRILVFGSFYLIAAAARALQMQEL